MITSIPLKMWVRRQDAPYEDTWSVVYWQPGKETGGMFTTLTNVLRGPLDALWKENGVRVKSHAFNPVDMPENERAKYFSLDEV